MFTILMKSNGKPNIFYVKQLLPMLKSSDKFKK